MGNTDSYKSWSGLRRYLDGNLCDELKGRITYFLTRYHKVHNAYGRAAIYLDGKEAAGFTWVQMYGQETDISELYKENSGLSYDEYAAQLKPKWDDSCTYNEMDFLDAVLRYRNLSIADALNSENYIIKVLAVMDKRVGKRTLEKIKNERAYLNYPQWVQRFYELRLTGM